MSARAFVMTVGVVFSIVALVHVVRLIEGWNMVIGGWSVPLWVSAVGVVIPGLLAFEGFWLGMRHGHAARIQSHT